MTVSGQWPGPGSSPATPRPRPQPSGVSPAVGEGRQPVVAVLPAAGDAGGDVGPASGCPGVHQEEGGHYSGWPRVNQLACTSHREGTTPWDARKLSNRDHWPGSASLDKLSAHRLSPVAILVLCSRKSPTYW